MIYFGKDSAVKIEMKNWFDIRIVTQIDDDLVIITAHLKENEDFRIVKKWIKNKFRWNARKYFEEDFGTFEEDSPLGIITYDRMDAMTSADYIYA